MSKTTSGSQKGTAKTEAIIGAAAAKLATAVANAQAAVSELQGMNESLEAKTLAHANMESQIAALEQDKINKVAQNELEIGLQFKADQQKYVTQFLGDQGLVAIPATEHQSLKTQVETLNKDMEANITERVNAATEQIKSEYDQQAKIAELTYSTKEAQNVAQIQFMQERINALQVENENWRTALDEQRKASVEMVRSSAVGTINVSGQK